MISYYKSLQAGEGRSEAMRQVQLQMLKDPRRKHPFYWASFIVSGEWWVAFFPGLFLMAAVFSFNLMGDGLRDIVDPRMRT